MSPITVLAGAAEQSADEIAKERRVDDVLGAIGIALALRARGDAELAALAEAPPRQLAQTIIAALDDGKNLDECAAAVLAFLHGGN